MGNTIIIKYRNFVLAFIVGSMVIGLSSCLTLKTVQIDVLKPAKITITPTIQSLTLLNASIPVKNEFPELTGASYAYLVDSLTTQELLKYINEKLLQSMRFTNVLMHDKLYARSGKEYLQPISTDDIEAICYQNNTDGLLALEAIQLTDTLIRYTIVDDYGFQTGKAFALLCKSLWRLYDASSKNTMVQKVFTDTIFFNEFDNSKHFYFAMKSSENREWLANTLANELGFKINETIVPYWVTVKRNLIDGSSSEMQRAALFASNDNWNNAAKIWQILTTNNDEKIASAACYNMALTCEVQGRLDLAITWLDKSDELYKYVFTEQYRAILNYRLAEEEMLNKQFGRE